MTQQSYNTIVKCIRYGAAAEADTLITELNGIIQANNDMQQKIAEAKENKEVKEEKK